MKLLFYATIFPYCVWSIQISSRSEAYTINIDKIETLKTVVDLRNQPVYEYSSKNLQLATMPKFEKMMVEFDLKIKKSHKDFDFQGTHILLLESNSSRIIFYLNGFGEFGMMHYNSEFDKFLSDEGTELLDFKLVFGRQRMTSYIKCVS